MKNKIAKTKKVKEKKEDSEKIRNIKFSILVIFCIILFSAVLAPITLQNDTFYTIKIGEHIAKTGTVDMQDPFSWNEGLPYTYPHWAYDLIIYLIYNVGGFTGIFISTVVFSSILGIVLYLTNKEISKNRLVSFIITLGAMYLLKDYIAARAQLVTFILLEVSVLFIEKFLNTKKIKYGIGLFAIAVAIANLHCAVWPFFFVLFLPYIAEYICTFNYEKLFFKHKQKTLNRNLEKYEKLNQNQKNEIKIEKIKNKIIKSKIQEDRILAKKELSKENPYKIKMKHIPAVKWLIIIMLICVFTGLCTPLGNTPYTYLIKTMQGNTTKSISEHLPLTLINNIPIMVTLTALMAILIFTDTKIRLKDLFMIVGMILLMFMTRRQVSMFVIFGSAVVSKLISNFLEKYDKNGTKEFEKIMVSTLGTIATVLIIVLFMIVQIKNKIGNTYVDRNTYPVEASKFIKENLDLNSIKLFNEYNYGSYLLYEGIPVFIDSRADLYAPEFNKAEGESKGRDIFSDYINTSSISKFYESTFKQYGVTHMILYKNSKMNMLIAKEPDKYKELYSDAKFIIYERDVE